MEEKSYSRCKTLMIFFNILFLLGGLALLAVGIWIIVDFGSFQSLTDASSLIFVYSSYIAIVIGSLIVIVAFCGCYGAWKESKCLLYIFNIILILMTIVEVAALILAFVFTNDVEGILRNAAFTSIRTEYGVDSATGFAVTEAWDFTHTAAGCCGVNNGTDFLGSAFDASQLTSQPWPLTCCVRNGAGGYVDASACLNSSPSSGANSNAGIGCYSYLLDLLTSYAIAAGVTAGVVILIQILALTFGCCVVSNIGNHDRVGAW